MSNKFADRFKGMDKAEVKSARLPSPALGKAAYKLESVRMHDNTRKEGYRVEAILTCLWPMEKGVDVKGEEVEANRPGDKVSLCFFSGDYFHKNFKELCLVACGKEPHEEMDIVEYVAGMEQYAPLFEGKDDLEKIEVLWCKVFPGLVCAFDAEGNPTDAGVFDGQVVLEVKTTEKEVPQLIDKKKGEVDGNYVFDASGNKLTKTYTNNYLNRKISMQEVGESLDEAGIKRFFGSTEAFMALLEQD